MKHVVLPPDIVGTDAAGDRQVLPAAIVITGTLLNDPVFLKSRSTIKASNKLEALFLDQPAGATVAVEDADWSVLREAAETPKQTFLPGIRKALAVLDAICEAKDVP